MKNTSTIVKVIAIILLVAICIGALVSLLGSSSGTGSSTRPGSIVSTRPNTSEPEESEPSPEPTYDALLFTLKDNSYYEVTAYNGKPTNIVIPSEYIGLPVTSIGREAFLGCNSLTSVIIPGSVVSINESAFAGCGSLDSVILGDGVAMIGDDAFYDSVLTSIIIPDSVFLIGSCAFEGCNLTSVTIGKNVISIGEDAFASCGNIESIAVAADNMNYHVSGNCLIETNNKILIRGCGDSVIPADGSVTKIADSAFDLNKTLNNLTIPDSVVEIGRSAFGNCTSLTSVTIGKGVTSIGAFAFSSDVPLTDVYYTGTQEQWNNINIGEYNTALTNATIHYNS